MCGGGDSKLVYYLGEQAMSCTRSTKEHKHLLLAY